MQALNDFVIIKREIVQVKHGTIFLKTKAPDEVNTGVVVSVGKDCKTLKVKDRVALPFYAKDELEYKGENYCYLHEKDIPAKL